ncbi:LysR family transcriptional regulator [filamentous cyanobacterium LEGE 11480]|uniref:LysR family transcriptional regulator n=1 Tax=Romeriopsis navalis LEGE 11480 TaxID=2777977 RepID=A0A928VLF8_9CYAN|nr:LysR family transcriptional regulator [Romeriopsis navalis]MBE9028537.1 LysR family transcriptional regulator [Romeriopsis navalis LEGE 11480]
MNLAGLDLNLLVVFDALIQERHVTRAGQRIGLSQPATSNALARLRKLTQDVLFIRTEGELRPTPVAIALAAQIQPALGQICHALTPELPFVPATSDRVFAIGLSDYTAFLLLPPLMQYLGEHAPDIVMQVRTGERGKLLRGLDTGEVDVICGIFPEQTPWHNSQLLWQEDFVCVCREQHGTIRQQLSLEEFVAADHLLVSIAEDRVGRVDRFLKQQNLTRHIALSVPHYLVAPFVLAQTDLVATLASRVAYSLRQSQSLKLLPLPIPLKPFSVFMRWHQSHDNDKAQMWLRSRLSEISQTLVEGNPVN